MNKIILQKRKSKYVGDSATGLTPEAYETLKTITDQTDMKMTDVASKLILTAAQYVEFADEA